MRSRNRQRRLFLSELGLNPEDAAVWAVKLNNLRKNSRKEAHTCELTFEEYVQLAVDAGLTSPSQIGPGLGLYQMARIGDTGDYKTGNCRFVTREQNILEWKLNGGSARMAESKKGQNASNHAGILAMAQKKRGMKFNKEGRKYEKIGVDPKGSECSPN